MRHKYLYIIFSALLATLACDTLLLPSATPVQVPTVDNAHEISSATPIPIPTVVNALEISNATIEYYDVSGSTESEIRDELNALSPVDENGYRGDALTSWEIHWNWDGYGTETCDLNSVTTSYNIVVRLPRWTPPPDAAAELVTKWNIYMFALVEHEKRHVENAMAYLPQVIETIRSAACDTAEDRAQEVLSQLRRDDLKYDEETHHGATQGAIFP